MATTTQHNKEHVKRVETAVNEQDHEGLAEIFAEDFDLTFHGGREAVHGLDEYREYLSEFYTAFPDLTMTIEAMVAEDDMVSVRYTASGTHEGEFRGVPPTGEEIQTSGMRMVRIEDGKIAEVWGQRDEIGLLAQLGVVEVPGQ